MKLVLTGATGFVGAELLKQALAHPKITSIISLSRRHVISTSSSTPTVTSGKLKSVICQDFTNYDDSVKKEIEGAEACIWLLAVTPSKSKAVSKENLREITLDYPATYLNTLSANNRTEPFKMIYVSGSAAQRDQSKKPWIMGDYSLLRGQAENLVLKAAKDSNGGITACIARPGLIDQAGRFNWVTDMGRNVLCTVAGLPRVGVEEIAACLIKQAVEGVEKETLENEDLVKIGTEILGEKESK